jgi:hypothetical protein
MMPTAFIARRSDGANFASNSDATRSASLSGESASRNSSGLSACRICERIESSTDRTTPSTTFRSCSSASRATGSIFISSSTDGSSRRIVLFKARLPQSTPIGEALERKAAG